MKYIIFLFVLMALGCLNSCLEDNTNLDYNTVILPDSVYVTNLQKEERVKFVQEIINTTYRVKAGDRLQLEVEVFYQGEEELTYEWRFEKEVISTEKKLDYVCAKTGSAMLLVYRKNAGNATCYKFDILVQSPYNSGIAILARDKNVTVIDFVETYYDRNVLVDVAGDKVNLSMCYRFVGYSDVYPLGNDGAALDVQEPVKLATYRGLNETPLRGIQVLDKNWASSVTVDGLAMEKMTEMGDEFIGIPENLRPKEFATVGIMNLLLSESGSIYTRVNYDAGNPCTGRYSSDPLAFNDPYDIPDKGPVILKAEHVFELSARSSAPFALIYEKENKRFLALVAVGGMGLWMNHDKNTMTMIALPRMQDRESLPKDYTDLDAVDKELIAVLGPITYGAEEMLFIFKDGANYYLQTNGFNVSDWSIPYVIDYTAKTCEPVKDSKVAALLANAGSRFEIYDKVIYFTSGNALYTMSLAGDNLQEIYRFPQTDKITSFRRMANPWYSPAASVVNRLYNGKVFCASFENGDFKVVQIYDDPAIPGKPQSRFLIDKHYDGGIADILYYQ